MEQKLAACNITKHYGDKLALNNVSLEVKPQQVIGLFGPNGAGKTTLFATLIGAIKPDSGTVYLNGVDITREPTYQRARRGIHYLPQEGSVFRGLSVANNIKVALELYEPDPDRREERLEDLLLRFKLTKLRDTKASKLSGGERRRVEIARALATNPQFLLLDEPLAAIDPIMVQKIKKMIHELKDMGLGIIITDHNVKDTLDVVDYAYILYNHGIISEGPPDMIVNNAEAREFYFGQHW